MKPFVEHIGVAAPLLRVNIDTDAIIPSREMTTVSKRGLAPGLFAGWRYLRNNSREIDPSFVLNQDAYANTSILLAGANFGCGSSREHAVWALAEYGIRAIIAPSFGSIFYNNCIRNGILPIVLDEGAVRALAEALARGDPQANPLHIDLPKQTVAVENGPRIAFDIAEAHRDMLLRGLDAIGLTEQLSDQIDSFIEQDRLQRAWAYPQASTTP